MLLAGVGLKSSGDPGRDSSCWELVLQGLLVGLGGGGDSWIIPDRHVVKVEELSSGQQLQMLHRH